MQASVSKYTGQATAAAAVSVTEETPGVPESNPSKRRMRKSQCVKELKVFLQSYLVTCVDSRSPLDLLLSRTPSTVNRRSWDHNFLSAPSIFSSSLLLPLTAHSFRQSFSLSLSV